MEKIAEITYSPCCPNNGGKPKCGLGNVQNNRRVEVLGLPFSILHRQKVLGGTANRGHALGRTYDVLILLEGISKEDDLYDLPTTGSIATRLIDCVMNSGLPTDSIYITSMVKCAPPKGRKASLSEIKSCLDHLKFELFKTRPKVVMLVGANTLRAFNLHNEGGIFKTRGNVYTVKYPGWEDGPTFKVIPTFNPSMFYYKQDAVAERRMQDDYILAAKVLSGKPIKNKPKNKFRLIQTTEQFYNMVEEIQSADLLAFDTESRGLNPHRNPMITMSFCWGYDTPGEKTAVLPIYRSSPTKNALGWNVELFWKNNKVRCSLEEIFSVLKTRVFENNNISKAAHNLKYDWQVVRKWVGSELKGRIYDTVILHHLLTEQRPHDLKYLADLEFGCGQYGDLVDNIAKDKGSYDRVPDHVLWPYAAVDAENVYRLACMYNFKILDIMTSGRNRKLYSLYQEKLVPALEALVESEWDGIRMNVTNIEKYKKAYEAEQEIILNFLKTTTNNPEFNPSSVVDVRNAAIAAGFNEEITNLDKASGYNTDRTVLLNLSSQWEAAEKILQYRNNRKMISTYLENALKDIDKDGRIRKGFLLHGTESGRLSCSFLHQIPKATKSGTFNLRDLFEAEDNCLFGYMDYKQIELKVYAVLIYLATGDDRLIKIFFDPNSDAHKKMASVLLGFPEDKISSLNRDLGKTFNFGAIFGSSGSDLVGKEFEDERGNRRAMTWNMVNNGILRFHNMYPSVKEYMSYVPDLARKQNGTYVSVFGRERHLGDALFSKDIAKRSAAERELINFTVQYPAAQITIDTMSLLNNKLKQFRKEGALKRSHARIVNTVHDSLMTEFHIKLKKWMLSLMKTTAERPIPELDNKIFTVDLGVGKTWSEAESNKVKEI